MVCVVYGWCMAGVWLVCSDYEKATYRLVARRNVVESMQALVAGCDRFNLHFQHTDSAGASKHLTGIDSAHADFWSDELIPAIKHLWSSEPAIKEMYRLRAQIQLIDSASYFFENVGRSIPYHTTPHFHYSQSNQSNQSNLIRHTIKF